MYKKLIKQIGDIMRHINIKGIISFGLIFIFLSSFSVPTLADGTPEPASSSIQTTGEIKVNAKSYIVMEATTGQILSENASNEKMPVSYLVKLMTLLLTMEVIKSNKLNMETMLSTSKYANSMGDPQIWLNVGEKISVDELIKSITIGNANDGCVVLAEAIGVTENDFVKMMNTKAAELGMTNTNFNNCTGIDCDGQYSTAHDIAVIAKELSKYDELVPYFTTWMTDVRGGNTNLVNTNLLVRNFNGITGMKAAASKAAGNCLVSTARRNNLNLICVMLNCNSSEQRFADAKALLNYSFGANEMFVPMVSDEILQPLNIKGGEVPKLEITTENKNGIVINKGTSSKIKVNAIFNEEVSAPISKGDQIGTIQFLNGDNVIYETKLIAQNDVRKMTIQIAFNKLLDYLLKF